MSLVVVVVGYHHPYSYYGVHGPTVVHIATDRHRDNANLSRDSLPLVLCWTRSHNVGAQKVIGDLLVYSILR